MSKKNIKKLLNDPRINISGICKGLNVKGLSRSSLINKLSDNNSQPLKSEDIEAVKKEFLKLSNDIMAIIK